MERQIHLIMKHSKTLGIKKKEKRMKFSFFIQNISIYSTTAFKIGW